LVHFGTAVAGRQGQAGTTEFEITRLVDRLSPKLTKATANGTIFKSASIQVYKPGTTTVGATYKLSNATISSDKVTSG
jgi:type VI protein secretion system component Hcp